MAGWSLSLAVAAAAAVGAHARDAGSPACDEPSKRKGCGFPGIDREGCVAKGCCWKPAGTNQGDLPWCFYSGGPGPAPGPAPPPAPAPPPLPSHPRDGQTFVHLFEWSWADVARECEQWLGPKGFSAVQVSPPNEHIAGGAWWTRYQPVTYELISRSGDEAAFADMVKRCAKVGVGIYADAVINHIASGSGRSIAGKTYGGRSTPIYSPTDMHHADHDSSRNCGINNYTDKWNVQNCDLMGMPDLCTGCEKVQRLVSQYLNHMHAIGISGFRVDAAKHQDATQLGQILSNVSADLFREHEVSFGANQAVTPDMYFALGHVTEFRYSGTLAPLLLNEQSDLGHSIGSMKTWGMMPADRAVVFVDNHDTQRDDPKLTHKKPELYQLANVLMLAHPYGYPKVMSSYFFNSKDQGPPSVPVHSGGNATACSPGPDAGGNAPSSPWVCEHRWLPIANMVAWRRAARGEKLTALQTQGGDKFSFCRGKAACVAFNRGATAWKATIKLTLPPGRYCNVIHSDEVGTCPSVTVELDGRAALSVPPLGAVALHVGKFVGLGVTVV